MCINWLLFVSIFPSSENIFHFIEEINTEKGLLPQAFLSESCFPIPEWKRNIWKLWSGGCYIVIFLPKGRIYAIFGIFASKCRYYGKCDGRMCQIRELGVTFALNLQNTGVYGGGRGRRMGRMDASEKFHSLGKIFRRYIDHYYKLFLFLKKCIAEINQKEMLLWTGVSSYSKNTAFFP